MKKFSLVVVAILCVAAIHSQVAINADDSPAEASALLDVKSTSSGMLIPRMTTVQRDAIASPVEGLMIYNTNDACVNFYDGTLWFNPCTGVASPSPLKFTFNSVAQYNGLSPVDGQGIGYYNETIDAGSASIDINITATGPGAYSFIATDAVTGLEYTATGSVTVAGAFVATLQNNSITPVAPGIINLTLTGASNTLALVVRIDLKSIAANAWTEGVDFQAVPTADGETWMDRNLGALRMATAYDDIFGYGSIFQWGRLADGHEIIVYKGNVSNEGAGLHGNTTTLSTTDVPGHNEFIREATPPWDWRSPQNAALWQGVSGTNNPCPSGYRLPTAAEFTALTTAEGITNIATAASSILALPASGYRNIFDGGISDASTIEYFWTSTTSANHSHAFIINASIVLVFSHGRSQGQVVRCIKD